MGSNTEWLGSAPSVGRIEAATLPTRGDEFRQLVEGLPHVVWTARADGALDYINRRGREYFGARLAPTSPEGFPHPALTHADDRAASAEAWRRVADGGKTFGVELRLQRADDRFLWHRLEAAPARGVQGEIVKWLGTATDIHDAKEADESSAFLLGLSTDVAGVEDPHERLCTAMTRLRQRLDVEQVSLAEVDATRAEVFVLGLGAGAGAELRVLRSPLERFRDLIGQAERGSVAAVADTGLDPHAGLRAAWLGFEPARSFVSAPFFRGDRLAAMLSVVEPRARVWTSAEIELTRRVGELVWPALENARAGREVALSAQRLRLAQAVVQLGVWQLDGASGVAYLSPESHELLGVATGAPDLLTAWRSVIDSRDEGALDRLIDSATQHGMAEAEYRIAHPRRGTRWIYCRCGRSDESAQPSLVGVSLDVTVRREAQEALHDVNRRKDEFLAMLGHELRNPLAPIRNAAQILRVHSGGKPQLEWARTVIERQTRHLARLVDDLLDVSRLVRGHIKLQKSSVDLVEIAQTAIETSRPLIRSRGHELHVELPTESVRVEGDPTRLAQIVSNLLINAAQYTEEPGHIWMRAQLEDARVAIAIRDTGPGIPPALLPFVFDLFTQAERPLDRAQGGLGLGLTMVKLLAELHGGEVLARNALGGKGAEFVVKLPVSGEQARPATTPTPDAPAAPESAQAVGAALRVLIVDDNVDAADSIALILNMQGFDARSVHSAKAALEAAREFEPEVLLLDIGLPVMDGFELARRLRAANPGTAPRIAALSGYGQPADRERAAGAGFDHYLVKPVEPGALTAWLRSLS